MKPTGIAKESQFGFFVWRLQLAYIFAILELLLRGIQSDTARRCGGYSIRTDICIKIVDREMKRLLIKQAQECALLGLLLTGIQFALDHSTARWQRRRSAFDQRERTG